MITVFNYNNTVHLPSPACHKIHSYNIIPFKSSSKSWDTAGSRREETISVLFITRFSLPSRMGDPSVLVGRIKEGTDDPMKLANRELLITLFYR